MLHTKKRGKLSLASLTLGEIQVGLPSKVKHVGIFLNNQLMYMELSPPKKVRGGYMLKALRVQFKPIQPQRWS